MKLIPLLAAGAVAFAGIAAVPAEAQRYGDRYDSGYHDDGYRGDHRRYDGRRDYRYNEWRREHGWRGHGWRDGYRGRGRVVCRVVRGYYGSERRCFRPW